MAGDVGLVMVIVCLRGGIEGCVAGSFVGRPCIVLASCAAEHSSTRLGYCACCCRRQEPVSAVETPPPPPRTTSPLMQGKCYRSNQRIFALFPAMPLRRASSLPRASRFRRNEMSTWWHSLERCIDGGVVISFVLQLW